MVREAEHNKNAAKWSPYLSKPDTEDNFAQARELTPARIKELGIDASNSAKTDYYESRIKLKEQRDKINDAAPERVKAATKVQAIYKDKMAREAPEEEA